MLCIFLVFFWYPSNCDILFKITNKLKVNNNFKFNNNFKSHLRLREHQKNTKITANISLNKKS